jgi:hypothetical protein
MIEDTGAPEPLTHIQLIIGEGNTAMMYSLGSEAATDAVVAAWATPHRRAFTFQTDNGQRFSYHSDKVLFIEQLGATEAKRRLDAFAAQQAEAKRVAQELGAMQQDPARRIVGARGPILRT